MVPDLSKGNPGCEKPMDDVLSVLHLSRICHVLVSFTQQVEWAMLLEPSQDAVEYSSPISTQAGYPVTKH